MCLNNQRFFHTIFQKSLTCFGILLLISGVAGAATRSTHPKNSSHQKSAVSSRKASAHIEMVSAKSRKTKIKKVRGQQAIQGDRAREIQTALAREGYLTGEPTGVWDQRTKDAMTRYQADHGWQTKTLPDSRALIQLGLGPDHKNAINAQATPAVLPAQVHPVKNSEFPENRQ
jgi:peptidoglycan hydrolase-like protein with peptidoglycan-binding domain